jgi:thiamine-phosphate pyrophosphorylase
MMKKNENFILTALFEIYPGDKPDSGTLNNLFAAGLDFLYLRTNAAKGIAWSQMLNDLGPENKGKVMVPAYAWKEAGTEQAILHLKEADRKGNPPPMFQPNRVYSTSVHHLPDVLDLPPCFRYVFYSPVFESISKPGYSPKIDLLAVQRILDRLKRSKGQLPIIIGLGGIHADNVKQVRDSGLNGAALMGALWQGADPVQAFNDIRTALAIP